MLPSTSLNIWSMCVTISVSLPDCVNSESVPIDYFYFLSILGLFSPICVLCMQLVGGWTFWYFFKRFWALFWMQSSHWETAWSFWVLLLSFIRQDQSSFRRGLHVPLTEAVTLLSTLSDAPCILRLSTLLYEIVKSSQPCGSSGSCSFQRFLPFSWGVSSHASTISTWQKTQGGPLQTSGAPSLRLSVLCLADSSPELSTVSSARRALPGFPLTALWPGHFWFWKMFDGFCYLVIVFLGKWLTAFWEYSEFSWRHLRHCLEIKFKFRFSPL